MRRSHLLTTALLSLLVACRPVELLHLDDETAAHLQARAMAAACREVPCEDRPVLVPNDSSPELRQALAASVSTEVRYVDELFAEALLGPDGSYLDGATAVAPSAHYQCGEDAIAVDVWTHTALLHGLRATHLFRFGGTVWVETTADRIGVTTSTAVS